MCCTVKKSNKDFSKIDMSKSLYSLRMLKIRIKNTESVIFYKLTSLLHFLQRAKAIP